NSPYPFADLGRAYALSLANLVGGVGAFDVTVEPVARYRAGDARRVARVFYVGSVYGAPIPEALARDVLSGA
ncbi:hypothetical protein, partial [Deinococcus pimensis]|uniref:hypothetical protein n=1 Tax=Deinococcus pimensis TaxID=309888 RepID=UPI0005EBCA17